MKRLKSCWVCILVLLPLFIFISSFSSSHAPNQPQSKSNIVDKLYVGYFDYSVGGGLYITVKVYVNPSNHSEIISGSDSFSQDFSATG
ncbi:MAG TPA: hypothetical protein VK031_03275, partial [Tissierellaceae bacterium]|nr:hypothetical protein [Tissierellaceae bacterium]